MSKPAGYDQAEERMVGNFDKPPAGPYVFKILKAAETKSSTNRPMMVLLIDIEEGRYKGHFKKLFDFLKSKNSEVKWPCVYRQCMDGDQVGYFKGVVKSIEVSNPGFAYNFNESSLVGKLVGGVLREKETDPSGAKTILEPMFLCDAGRARVGEFKTPTVKKYSGGGSNRSNNDSWGEGAGVNSGVPASYAPPQEDLPF